MTTEVQQRLFAKLTAFDPNWDILAAWITKENLRDVLACKERGALRYEIGRKLDLFYTFAAACDVPEIRTFANTISTWQDPMITAIQTGISNAASEGQNRIVKHIGRIAFGFRNPTNQRRRVRWACTRRTRQAPPKITLHCPH